MISKAIELATVATLTLAQSRWDDDWTKDHEGEIVHWDDEDEGVVFED